MTGSDSEPEGPLWEVGTSQFTCLCSRDFACLLCPFLARIRLPALELPAMAQQVANRMLEDHLRVVSRTPAHRE
jgi:hypothetical protein